MKPGVTITWPEADPDLGAHRVEYVPGDRDLFMMWRDQFGTLHATGWGPHVDPDTEAFDAAAERLIDTLFAVAD